MFSERVYRCLLFAYPREHRRAYGEPMVQLFRDRMRRDGDGFRALAVWPHMVFDLLWSAFEEHREGVAMSRLGLMESPLPNLVYRGKVRDTHEVDDKLFLMLATDRISAFDVVLPTAVPDKGAVLSQISYFWFDQTAKTSCPITWSPGLPTGLSWTSPPTLHSQAMVVRRAERIDVECVIRGYITGSAWSEYKESGTVQGMPMPSGAPGGRQVPGAAVHSDHQGRGGSRREYDDGRGRGDGGQGRGKAAGGHHGGRLQQGARHRPLQGHRHSRHEDGVRLHRRRADAHRRAADAGLEPVLGRRGLRARQVPAQLRQAVRQGLARRAGLGPRTAGARNCPTKSSKRPVCATSRRTSG